MTPEALARLVAGLEKGRQRAIAYQRERAADLDRAVRRALDLDILAGRREWGRRSRIAKALKVTPQGVGKVLKRLSYRYNSAGYRPDNETPGG